MRFTMRKTVLFILISTIGTTFAIIGYADPVNEAQYDRRTPIVQAYQKVDESVVNIAGKKMVESYVEPMPEYFFAPRRFNRSYRAERLELGSGVVIHEDGYVVTNAHVIKDTKEVQVTFSNGKEYEADIIRADVDKDLAFLKIRSDEKFKAVELGKSCDLLIGETVIAVGNPFGYSNTVTEGIISALGRDLQVNKDFWLRGLIQTSAPINPGNSGGPLLNINGELIGINTAINAQAQNIGFAIPVDTMAENLIHMLMPEEMRRVRLGLVIGRMRCENENHGLSVDKIIEGSPAQKQGVREGDLIVAIDGKDVKGFIDFYVKIMEKEIGDTIEVDFIRLGDEKENKLTARLQLLPRPIPDGKKLTSDYFQMEVSELNETVAKKFDFDSTYPVLIVTDLDRDGIAQQAGLEPGDIILQFNNSTITNTKELALAMEKIKDGDDIVLRILRIGWRGRYQVQREYLVRLKANKKIIKNTQLL